MKKLIQHSEKNHKPRDENGSRASYVRRGKEILECKELSYGKTYFCYTKEDWLIITVVLGLFESVQLQPLQ